MYKEIDSINIDISKIQPKNVLWGMKKTQSFTIENVNLVEAHASYTMDIFQYLFKRIILFLGAETSFFSYVVQLSYKKALMNIFEKNFVSDHILINKIEFKHDGFRTVTCIISGASIRMYPETLPLFNFVPNFDPRLRKIEQRHNFSHLINGISALSIACFLTIGYLSNLSLNLAKNSTHEDQEILWSYLHFLVERELHQEREYVVAQEKIQEILNKIEKPQGLESFNFKIFIVQDSDDIDMVLLPAGNIVITSAMVERFDTENEIAFILASAIYMYKDNYILEALGNNYLSMYWILTHFGKDSLFGRVFVLYRDFDNLNFDTSKESEADEFAISEIHRIYGHVGGLDSLRFKIENELANDHSFFEKHPITKERLEHIEKYVEEKGYNYDLQNIISFKIANKVPKPDAVKIIPSQKSAEDEFNDSFKLYRAELASLQYAYYTEFGKLDGIIFIKSNTTKDDLVSRINEIDSIGKNLRSYDKFYDDLFVKYDEKMKSIIERISDKDKRALNKAVWDKELILSKQNTMFMLSRDKDVIVAQKAILNFLISRYGSYEIKGGNISFSTEKERSDYSDLKDNLNLIINRKP